MNYQIMKEMISNRYFYLQANLPYILGPNLPSTSIETNPKLLFAIEDILLGENLLTLNQGYLYLETLKKNKDYLIKVNQGLQELKKYNVQYSNLKKFQITLSIIDILNQVYDYIDYDEIYSQTKINKLHLLDEYFKLARFQNDGKVRTSGRYLRADDAFNFGIESSVLAGDLIKMAHANHSHIKCPVESRYQHITDNLFIKDFSKMQLTEEDKYEINSILQLTKKKKKN